MINKTLIIGESLATMTNQDEGLALTKFGLVSDQQRDFRLLLLSSIVMVALLFTLIISYYSKCNLHFD